jgi:hypothetical protein
MNWKEKRRRIGLVQIAVMVFWILASFAGIALESSRGWALAVVGTLGMLGFMAWVIRDSRKITPIHFCRVEDVKHGFIRQPFSGDSAVRATQSDSRMHRMCTDLHFAAKQALGLPQTHPLSCAASALFSVG